MKSGFAVICLYVILLSIHSHASAQGFQKKVIIHWSGIRTITGNGNMPLNVLFAPGLLNKVSKNFTPEYFEKFALPATAGSCDLLVTHTEWEPIGVGELSLLTFPLQPDDTLTPVINRGTERGVNVVMLTLVPIVVNPEGGLMRLKSFTVDVVYLPVKTEDAVPKSSFYTSHSVLSQGNWYKIHLDNTGIYKVTYSDIQAMGIDMADVNPEHIRLFGNGGGLLPEANNIPRYDDLSENAISVVTAKPGVFAPGDYLLFYGTSPHKMVYNKVAHKFEHTTNIYSDYTYYFLNFDGAAGLRVQDQEQLAEVPSYTCSTFVEGVFYEKEQLNFINSGKEWFGERMDANNPGFELPEFTFPNLKTGKQCWIRYRAVARAATSTTFNVLINGKSIASPSCSSYGPYDYASHCAATKSFYPETDKVKVAFKYNGGGSSIGWLDWVELNVPRELIFTGGQMAFADPYSIFPGFVTDFRLQASSANVKIWEVTNPIHVKRVIADLQGDTSRFVLKTDSLRQFVAWDNTSFLTASFAGKVANQDLHGTAAADLLIVTHNDYLDEANRLAEHHRIFDGLRVAVATNEQIYNEFSSGAPDDVAIRDFARMLYQKPDAGNKLRYLLLFGDASYDYKDRVAGNTNRVPAFQTRESLNTVASYACDDFYGQLDDNEGYDASGLIDLGIGRFPVSTVGQAKVAVDKCISYATNSEKTLGDWRNKICLVADDGNQNLHFRQAETDLAPLIEDIGNVYNVNKIYTDAFKQISTPSGERCPSVNEAINASVSNGVLIMNYTGHGGETGWADEGILSVREIDAWTNSGHLPVFITATCEFSRYDDPSRMSAGEHVFLNPLGGGIALFTTSRLASPIPNIRLNINIYKALFTPDNGKYLRFGDAIAFAKNNALENEISLIRNFALLGDPALQLAYPENTVITTSINGKDMGQQPDTIPAMSPVEIKGMVADQAGNKLTGFTGILDVKVFDKVRSLKTLGTDPTDWPETYTVQDNYIYQGRASVTNGDFTVRFIVPRDIDYTRGPGKISYYAQDGVTDANGFSKQLMIGGSGTESTDKTGPLISLFMDDLNFKNGGITGDTPLLIARVSDVSGINTIGNAIGHDIVATIDGDNSSSIVLNSYYMADLDSYQSGVVTYQLAQLTEGLHTLTLKAWDVFNNSSESTIRFIVKKNRHLAITRMDVFPNPFRDEVNVEFEVNLFNSTVEAHLEVFDINGSLVRATNTVLLLTEGYKAGKLVWDGRTSSGSVALPGVYLVAVRVGNGNSETVKAGKVIKVR